MDQSDLVNSLVDMFGPRIDKELARELAENQPEVWLVRQENYLRETTE